MIKFVCLIPRRPDLTREQFFVRWRNEHATLVKRHAETLGIRRYVQSHRIESAALAGFKAMRDWPEAGFDGLTEIWLDSLEAFARSISTPEGRLANQALAADEAEFADQPRVIVFMSEEHEII